MVDVDVLHKKKKEDAYQRRLKEQRTKIMKDAEKVCNARIAQMNKEMKAKWDAALQKIRSREKMNKKSFEHNIERSKAIFNENKQLKKRISELKRLEEANKVITEGNRQRYIARFNENKRLKQEVAKLKEEIATRDAAESLATMGKRQRINFTKLNY